MSKKKTADTIVIAYVPVLHEGYQRFFKKHSGAKALYILGKDITSEFSPLAKDIRALDAQLISKSVRSWKFFKKIKILDKNSILKLKLKENIKVFMPDENVMHELKERYWADIHIRFDSIFLRWDKNKSTENIKVEVKQSFSSDDSDQEIISILRKEAEKSSDFWRHVGAAIVKDGKIILKTHNAHVPHEQMPYVNGDPRSDFHKGVNIELSTAMHAEARLIAEAAKKGRKLEGASMYVTTFPCPPCAKLIAYSGIKELYYADGYGVLDGESVLKSQGVKIVFVDTSGEHS